MSKTPTISLEAIRALIAERVHDSGGFHAFARLHGLTASAWSNLVHDARRRPGPAMLAAIGYVEDAPRYRKA